MIRNTTTGYITKWKKISMLKRHLHSLIYCRLVKIAKKWKQPNVYQLMSG
jgi:hypothetical protein